MIDSKDAESHLLFAYLIMLFNPEEKPSALKLLDLGISHIDEELLEASAGEIKNYELILAEFYFVKSILLRLMGNLAEARSTCKCAIDINKSDARFWKEHALHIWRLIDSSKLKNSGKVNSVSKALEAARKAKKLASLDVSDKLLLIKILSNLTFYYLMRDSRGDVSRARNEFTALEDLIPDEKFWYPEIMGVKALLLLRMAELAKANSTRVNLLIDACNYARMAVNHKLPMREVATERAIDTLNRARALLDQLELPS